MNTPAFVLVVSARSSAVEAQMEAALIQPVGRSKAVEVELRTKADLIDRIGFRMVV